ncbi:histone H4 transcription factor [Anopheles cruzii]|uniref:histone H4 transcription factor n=1 Tax=Anopheles cruzii TaxID=68878 RepID=UPI0022EC2405|nr:histone H4 transcription factor [Anopheles cruzii]
MVKPSKKRKRQQSGNEQKAAKKPKPQSTSKEQVREESIVGTDSTIRDDPVLDHRNGKVQQWMQQQEPFETVGYDDVEDEISEDENEQSTVLPEDTEIPMRISLKNRNELERRTSVKYECEWSKCQFLTGHDRKYFQHIERHAAKASVNGDGCFACLWDLCDFVADNLDELVSHVHYHGYHTKLKVHGASLNILLKIHKCNYDSRMRNTITSRRITFECEWEGCGEHINKVMEFFYHIQSHILDMFPTGQKHTDEPVRCGWSFCDKTFSGLQRFTKHMLKHTGQKDIACYNCGDMFCERVKYIDHCNRQIELGRRKYQCTECDRYYSTERLLKNHMNSHKKQASCPSCPLAFATQTALSRHILARHLKERPFMCNECSYRSVTKYELEKHIVTHSTNAQKNLYRCSEFGCNAVYKCEASIKRHISSHYRQPTHYECHICSKSYTMGYTLSKHLHQLHHMERQPGHNRFRYKLDTDGIYRLATYVERNKNSTASARGRSVVDATDSDKVPEKSESEAEKAEPKRQMKTRSSSVKLDPAVSAIEPIGHNVFAVQVSFPVVSGDQSQSGDEVDEMVTESPEQPVQANGTEAKRTKSQAQPQPEEKTTPKAKKVQDFTVMKRYLKVSKMPKIDGKLG